MLSFLHVNQLSLGRDLWKIESRARLTSCQYDRREAFGWGGLVLVCFGWWGIFKWSPEPRKHFCAGWMKSWTLGEIKTVKSQSEETKSPFQYLLRINNLCRGGENIEIQAICLHIEYLSTSKLKHRNKVERSVSEDYILGCFGRKHLLSSCFLSKPYAVSFSKYLY